jgi:uncharacterized membrane protein (UPF0127 family)
VINKKEATYPLKFIIFLLLFSLCNLFISCNKKSVHSIDIIPQNGKPIPIAIEVEDTPQGREQGLMYRESLDENAGMLFIMPNEQIQTFWMKDTKISLDIIFIFSDWKIAGYAENTQPFSRDQIAIDKPTKYVLEVNAGFCKKHGIQPGDKIIYHPLE